ncbi:hypothetical protein DRO91_10700, partial [Candidatus Heimdallarchaeota archaeon]
NDTETGTLRNISSFSSLNLTQIWDSNPWNTGSNPSGYYRVFAKFTDLQRNTLKNQDNSEMSNYAVFYLDIIPPNYNNFNANDSTPKPGEYVKFYANWTDNGELGSWALYWNVSGSWNKNDTGIFSSTPDWSNTTLQIPSSAEGLLVKFAFFANDSQGAYNWTSNKTMLVKDITKPNITSTNAEPLAMHRNETVNITAIITDNIGVNHSWAHIQNSGTANKTMGIFSGDMYNVSYKCTEIGNYNVTVYANDSYNNVGNGSAVFWKVFGWADVTYLAPASGNYPVRGIIDITCLVSDANLSQGIGSYPVKFYYNSTFLGTNYTNSTGHSVYYWNTTGLSEDDYLVRCIILDNETLFYNDSIGEDNETIHIDVPDVRLIDLEHENSNDEYEIEDTISWVNLTLNNTGGASALHANVSLFVVEETTFIKQDWGPDKTLLCSDELGSYQTCEADFDNSTSGYKIPLTASTGRYVWNATLNWTGGGTPPNYNSSYSFDVFDVRQNMSSLINPDCIDQNDSAIYNFTLVNPFSSSLTNVNISINCFDTNANCTCTGTSNSYCELGTIASGSSKTASFNITTDSSTSIGYVNINATVEYTNPGSESKKWEQQKNELLYIRGPTKLNTNIFQYPLTATRGSSFDLKGLVNNTGTLTNNIWLNWTLPFGMNNITGNLNELNLTLAQNKIFWNNITAEANSSVSLGTNNVKIVSASDEESEDTNLVSIDIYSNTSVGSVSDSTERLRNQAIIFYANLTYDNSTGVYNELVNFRDITDDYDFGNAYTNSSGIAKLETTIPISASLGEHAINMSYSGSSLKYTHSSSNSSLKININDSITFDSIQASPS